MRTDKSQPPAPLGEMVHPKERLYFWLCVVISVLLYAWLIIVIVRVAEAGVVLFYVIAFGLLGFLIHALFVGHIRGNAVRLSPRQFPDLYEVASKHSATLGISTPDIYLMQAGGVLNAFATRFLRRHFVVLYSDVVELALEKGVAALGFVLAHELGHVQRKHLKRRWLLYPSLFVPFLRSAYSRACEYTCDRIGSYCEPGGARDGLLVLAAGKRLYRDVDAREYMRQIESERGFWVWYAEIISSHPNLPKRLAAVEPYSSERPAPPTPPAAFAPT